MRNIVLMEYIDKVVTHWREMIQEYGKSAIQTEELYVSAARLTKYQETLSKWLKNDDWYDYGGFRFKLKTR